MKSQTELKKLHGEQYVEAYKNNSPMRLQRLLGYIAIDSTLSVAEYACGNGMLMEIIAPKVKSYVGVDFSEPFIRAANIKKEALAIKNAEFVCSDISEFCRWHVNTFDVCFAMDVSEHIYDEEWVKILKSIKESLKPGGRLYVHTPNAEFFLEIMKSRDLIFRQLPEHIAVRTPGYNASLLREGGFDIKHIWSIPHYNVLRLIHPLSYLPVIGNFFKARILIEATN